MLVCTSSLRTWLRATLGMCAICLAGCTTELDQATRDSPIGDFQLKHLVVVVDAPFSPPVSRGIGDDALKAAIEAAVSERLGRFEGGGNYSIGIKVSGYVLAPRAVPILFAPRSQLYLNLLAYDATPARLNADPRRLVVNERAGGDTVIGSGYTQTAEEQLAELAENAAIEIEKWLRENAEWFAPVAAGGTERSGA